MSRLDLLRATLVGRHLANVPLEEPLPEDTAPDHADEAPDTVRDHPPSTLRQGQP